MKKYKFPKSHPEAGNSKLFLSSTNDFSLVIRQSIERGESLDQLAERIDQENTPAFYGAEFRRAYSEGIEAGSSYGYEHPLDLHDAMKNMGEGVEKLNSAFFEANEAFYNFLNAFPQKVETFHCSEEVTEEAEFEVVESGLPIEVEEEIEEPLWRKGRCWAELAVEEYFGLNSNVGEGVEIKTDYGQIVGCLYLFKEKYLDKQEPGKDLIITPLGEMAFEDWDKLLLSMSEEERKQYEAPEN